MTRFAAVIVLTLRQRDLLVARRTMDGSAENWAATDIQYRVFSCACCASQILRAVVHVIEFVQAWASGSCDVILLRFSPRSRAHNPARPTLLSIRPRGSIGGYKSPFPIPKMQSAIHPPAQ